LARNTLAALPVKLTKLTLRRLPANAVTQCRLARPGKTRSET